MVVQNVNVRRSRRPVKRMKLPSWHRPKRAEGNEKNNASFALNIHSQNHAFSLAHCRSSSMASPDSSLDTFHYHLPALFIRSFTALNIRRSTKKSVCFFPFVGWKYVLVVCGASVAKWARLRLSFKDSRSSFDVLARISSQILQNLPFSVLFSG